MQGRVRDWQPGGSMPQHHYPRKRLRVCLRKVLIYPLPPTHAARQHRPTRARRQTHPGLHLVKGADRQAVGRRSKRVLAEPGSHAGRHRKHGAKDAQAVQQAQRHDRVRACGVDGWVG